MIARLLLTLLVFSQSSQSRETLDQAINLYHYGRFEEAVDLLSQASGSQPNDPRLRLWFGKSLLKLQKWDEAVREIEKAVELDQTNALYHLWLGRACGARASHSVFFRAVGWARRVAKEFETARAMDPNNLDVRFDLLDFYLNAPGILGGGRDKAEVEAEAISKLDPQKSYSAYVMIFEKDKKWDLAEKELVKATEEFPDYIHALNDTAEFFLASKHYANALKYARRALSLDGESKRARLVEVAAETRLDSNLEEAEKTLREIAAGPLADEDPTFEEVYYWLGECCLARGYMKEAREAFQSALSFNPEYDKAKDALSGLR